MAQWHLSEREWKTLSPFLRIASLAGIRRYPGRPRKTDDRLPAEACLFRFFHSLAPVNRAFGWNQIPKSLGVSPATANRRFREWTGSGAWTRFWSALQELRSRPVVVLPVRSPVLAAVAELQRAFSFLNMRLFGNALPARILLTIESLRRPRVLGMFSPLYESGHIAVAFRTIKAGPLEVLHTLIHEMVHFRNHVAKLPDVHNHYHNRHFRDAAAAAGLICTWEPNRGYGSTRLARRARQAISSLGLKRQLFRWTILSGSRKYTRGIARLTVG